MPAAADRALRIEVFHHLFASTAEEMGAALRRSSFSPNIKERRDYSCALFDARGRLIGQAAHLPVHLGSTALSVEAVLEDLELGPGDVALLNDPYRGGTHLPDVTAVAPVFLPGDERPSFFVANRAHHADVGGGEPGSMAPAYDVHGEGLRIPPLRLVRAGELDREVLGLLLANMRAPREREGDLLAQLSANKVGAEGLALLVEEHGRELVLGMAGELMDWTERLSRRALARVPDGTHAFEDELEGSEEGGPARLRLSLVVRGDRASFDFRGTDDALEGPVNTVRAVCVSAVFYALRLLLPADTPTNAGVLRPVSIRTRPGSLVDARYPACVAAGNVETSQRLVDVCLGALGRALGGGFPAASAGTMSNLTFGGQHEGAGFAYYETLGGGAGASPQGPGAHALQTHMTNTRNTPIEALERELPVRVRALGVRRGSGGAGRHRGGDGLRKRLLFLAPMRVGWVAERQLRGPWGLAGGRAGRPGGAWLLGPKARRRLRLGGRLALAVDAGSELELHTPGGGGWGSPAG